MSAENPFQGAKLVYMCCLCGGEIEQNATDPCALIVVAGWAGPEEAQRSQQFWCHGTCLEGAVDGSVADELFVTRGS